jgi:hypothetical protein
LHVTITPGSAGYSSTEIRHIISPSEVERLRTAAAAALSDSIPNFRDASLDSYHLLHLPRRAV